MSWYKFNVSHDRVQRGSVVWLEDTPDVELRLAKGYIEAAEEPEWHRRKNVQRERHDLDPDRI
jgi:hypothetical protein